MLPEGGMSKQPRAVLTTHEMRAQFGVMQQNLQGYQADRQGRNLCSGQEMTVSRLLLDVHREAKNDSTEIHS